MRRSLEILLVKIAWRKGEILTRLVLLYQLHIQIDWIMIGQKGALQQKFGDVKLQRTWILSVFKNKLLLVRSTTSFALMQAVHKRTHCQFTAHTFPNPARKLINKPDFMQTFILPVHNQHLSLQFHLLPKTKTMQICCRQNHAKTPTASQTAFPQI